MPPDLSADTRRKLVGVLGMLGSIHPGERDAAGLTAHRLVQAAGLTWDAVVVPRPERPSERPPPPRDPPPMSWRAVAIRCSAHPAWLSDWERGFLAELPRRVHLSEKQYAVLARIARKLRSRGVSV